ncbi:MAG: hypothetical protein ABFS34_05090 [Gemmatimonadota bacterium]
MTFVTDDLREAYEGMTELEGLATVGHVDLLGGVIGEHGDGEAIFDAYDDALNQRWYDQESGRYEAPERSGGGVRRGHGFR